MTEAHPAHSTGSASREGGGTFVAAQILATGKIPFLHVKSENGAKVVYQKIGFRLRAEIWLTVLSVR